MGFVTFYQEVNVQLCFPVGLGVGARVVDQDVDGAEVILALDEGLLKVGGGPDVNPHVQDILLAKFGSKLRLSGLAILQK